MYTSTPMKDDSKEDKKEISSPLDVPYLTELLKPKHIIVKVVWVVIFMGMIAIGGYMTVLLVRDYKRHSSFNVYSVKNIRNFTLPAITICNVNLFNATHIEENNKNALDLYYEYHDKHKKLNDTEDDDSNEDADKIKELNDAKFYKASAMKFEEMIIKSETSFGRKEIRGSLLKSITNYVYTEMGMCLDINDDGNLVQQVEGPGGGLTLVLDANLDHYLKTTETQGFYVTLRMPNETIVNRGFGFTVSPGEEVMVEIDEHDITRLGQPWGECEDHPDVINIKTNTNDHLTKKECFLLQKIWSYLRDGKCRCYPWYVWQRYMTNDTNSVDFDDELEERLLWYLTGEVATEKQLTFNRTCFSSVRKNGNNGYYEIYEGDVLALVEGIANAASCAAQCRAQLNCVLFMFARTENDYLGANQCQLLSRNTRTVRVDASVTNVTSLMTGSVNCTGDLEECSLTEGLKCEDDTMRNIMSDDEFYQPFGCRETCQHFEYKYSLSRSGYPARRYWDEYLSKVVTKYSDLAEAKAYEEAHRNLVKLIFFTKRMQATSIVQTPSYEVQSFVAELGGLTDLFIGISFFTFFQLIDLALTKLTKRAPLPRKRKVDSANSKTTEGKEPFYLEDT